MTDMPRIVFSAVMIFAATAIACDGGDEAGDEMATGEGTSSGGETGDPSGTETTGEDDCPVGSFDCPCGPDNVCDAGLACNLDGVCALDGSGTSTTESTTTSSSGTTAGAPSLYEPEECEAPAEVLMVEMIEGQFCSSPCVIDEDCPEGPSGTTPACSISTIGGEPNHCALLCEPTPDGEVCPNGSTCKPVPQQPNYGLCTFP